MSMVAPSAGNLCYKSNATYSGSSMTLTLEPEEQIGDNLPWSPLIASGQKASFRTFREELLQFNRDDEEDQISANALTAALFTTSRAYSESPNRWRNPRIATDGSGGVRLSWKFGDKEIRAVFPSEMRRPQYLYEEQGENHCIIRNFTSITLSNKFDWLLS